MGDLLLPLIPRRLTLTHRDIFIILSMIKLRRNGAAIWILQIIFVPSSLLVILSPQLALSLSLSLLPQAYSSQASQTSSSPLQLFQRLMLPKCTRYEAILFSLVSIR